MSTTRLFSWRSLLFDHTTRQAVAGTLHNVLLGHLNVEFDASLLGNGELLERVAVYNAGLNTNTGRRRRTYMLSQVH